MDDANEKIAKYVKQTTGIHTKKRYNEIIKKLSEIAKALKQSIANGTDINGVIDYELRKQAKLLKKIGDKISLLLPTLEQIQTAATFAPIAKSMTFQSYLESIEYGLYNTWDSYLRTGYLTGEPTKNIVRKVIGTVVDKKVLEQGAIQTLRNSVYANTRTVLQSFATETRNKVYEQNENLFGDNKGYKYEYLATLDTRTCMVCGELDGKRFKTLKEVPKTPQHIGCRCLVIPSIDIENEYRASVDGVVKSGVSYEEWLESQSEEVKKDVLGISRYNIYKKGNPIKTFVDNGKILTLDELNNRLN